MFEKLDARLAKEKEHLELASGKHPIFSPTGPVGLGLVEELIAVVKAQGAEIQSLKRQIDDLNGRLPPGRIEVIGE